MTVRHLHHNAMRAASIGDCAARQGGRGEAWHFVAAALEQKAFGRLPAEAASEPTRAILGLSAASLWWGIGRYANAMAVIRAALPTATLTAVPFEHRELVNLLRRCEVDARQGGEGKAA